MTVSTKIIQNQIIDNLVRIKIRKFLTLSGSLNEQNPINILPKYITQNFYVVIVR